MSKVTGRGVQTHQRHLLLPRFVLCSTPALAVSPTDCMFQTACRPNQQRLQVSHLGQLKGLDGLSCALPQQLPQSFSSSTPALAVALQSSNVLAELH